MALFKGEEGPYILLAFTGFDLYQLFSWAIRCDAHCRTFIVVVLLV